MGERWKWKGKRTKGDGEWVGGQTEEGTRPAQPLQVKLPKPRETGKVTNGRRNLVRDLWDGVIKSRGTPSFCGAHSQRKLKE